MRKKLIALLLAAGLLTSNAMAVNTNTYTPLEKTADALNHLGLLAGTGTSYDLEAPLRRDAGITLLVKLLGKEGEAKAGGDFGMPFTDVPDWAKGFAGYAWANKITSGVAAERFGSEMAMTDYMFLTLTLHALGYTDSGENPQFVWNDPYAFAHAVGLIDSAEADPVFTRGDAVKIFWNAMAVKFNGGENVLSQSLIQQGVFTAKKFAQAEKIQENGRTKYQGVPAQPEVGEDDDNDRPASKPSTPSAPSAPAKPEKPSVPEPPAEPEKPSSNGGTILPDDEF